MYLKPMSWTDCKIIIQKWFISFQRLWDSEKCYSNVSASAAYFPEMELSVPCWNVCQQVLAYTTCQKKAI